MKILHLRVPVVMTILLCGCSCGSYGDAITDVSGRIVESTTGTGIPGVRIFAFGDSLPGDISDGSGNYRIDCGFGKYEGPLRFESELHVGLTKQIPGNASAVDGKFSYRLDLELIPRAD